MAPDGIDLTYLRLPVEETFLRMVRHREFHAAEMSLSSYAASLSRTRAAGEPPPFVPIPAFTSRTCRGEMSVNADSGIDQPADLRGWRFGNAEPPASSRPWPPLLPGPLDEAADARGPRGAKDSESTPVGG